MTIIEEYEQEAHDILKCIEICFDNNNKEKLLTIGLNRSFNSIYSKLEEKDEGDCLFNIGYSSSNSVDFIKDDFDIHFSKNNDEFSITYRNKSGEKKSKYIVNPDESYTEEQIFQYSLDDDYLKYKCIYMFKYFKSQKENIKFDFYMYSKLFYKFRYLILGLANEENKDSTDNI